MVVQNLRDTSYQSKEARLFLLKNKANKVSDFIGGLRKAKGKVYLQILSGVTGIEALVTLQSFLLQVALYYRKTQNSTMNSILEINRAHIALATYYTEGTFSEIVTYLNEIKALFELIKE